MIIFLLVFFTFSKLYAHTQALKLSGTHRGSHTACTPLSTCIISSIYDDSFLALSISNEANSEILFTLSHYFQNHFHPSVKVYSEKFFKGSKLEYNGDPFIDFTLIKFLDKFVNRKPKKEKELTKECELTLP